MTVRWQCVTLKWTNVSQFHHINNINSCKLLLIGYRRLKIYTVVMIQHERL